MTVFIFINSLLLFFFLLRKILPWIINNQNSILSLINKSLIIELSMAEHLRLLKKSIPGLILISFVFLYIFPINIIYYLLYLCTLMFFYLARIRKTQQQMLDALTLDFPFFLNLLQSQLKIGRSIYQSIEKIDACLQQSPLKNLLLDFNSLSKTIPSLNIVANKIHSRYPNKYVQSFSNILIESIQHGTPIVESLQSFADDVENQIYLDAEQQIQKIPVKLLAPLMLCIFPVTFIIIFIPIILSFSQ